MPHLCLFEYPRRDLCSTLYIHVYTYLIYGMRVSVRVPPPGVCLFLYVGYEKVKHTYIPPHPPPPGPVSVVHFFGQLPRYCRPRCATERDYSQEALPQGRRVRARRYPWCSDLHHKEQQPRHTTAAKNTERGRRYIHDIFLSVLYRCSGH